MNYHSASMLGEFLDAALGQSVPKVGVDKVRVCQCHMCLEIVVGKYAIVGMVMKYFYPTCIGKWQKPLWLPLSHLPMLISVDQHNSTLRLDQ
jgi:hypothetical protein